ncbi:MAG: IS6 family transposase [Candidatus Paracaedibacteraceae bacterium]|nr:IS6 family transposase [Candidatus Paracaedibacteraceae bacterium]
MQPQSAIYKGYRFSREIISHAVWIYYRLNASLRDTSQALLYRGLDVSHETIRAWVSKFGPLYASGLKKRQPQRGDKWHLDEVCLRMNGRSYWLWRAIDQDGYELDVLVQLRRSAKAALRFFKKLLKGLQYVPRVMITDKLRSYTAAKKKLLKTTEHRRHKRLNNCIEVSHQPTRLREKQMRRFKSPPHAQLFLSVFGVFRNWFRVGLYKLSAEERRCKLKEAFAQCHQITSQPNYA